MKKLFKELMGFRLAMMPNYSQKELHNKYALSIWISAFVYIFLFLYSNDITSYVEIDKVIEVGAGIAITGLVFFFTAINMNKSISDG